uniref:Putative secreted protein n=1 Tax=Xenopsylla cheopis TaxID=163159 RepID=A0A6M2DIK5_XENCH
MAKIIQSFLWLIGFGGLGYTLFKVATPDESALLKQLAREKPTEAAELYKKRGAFVDALKAAAETDEPLYRRARGKSEPRV